MTLRGEEKPLNKRSAHRFLLMSLALPLDKIRDSTGADAMDEINEIISILHEKYFNLAVLSNKVDSHEDCQRITKDVIE